MKQSWIISGDRSHESTRKDYKLQKQNKHIGRQNPLFIVMEYTRCMYVANIVDMIIYKKIWFVFCYSLHILDEYV